MNILVLSAHPDDLEMSCGGSVARWIAEGHTVFNMVMVTEVPQKDLLTKSAENLGFNIVDIGNKRDLIVSSSLVKDVEDAIENLNINRIITHWKEDWHQDHRACYELGNILARKQPKELWYMSSHPYHNKYSQFEPEIFVDISSYTDKKISSINIYKDFIGFSWYSGIIHHDAWRGSFIETASAEVFKLGNTVQ